PAQRPADGRALLRLLEEGPEASRGVPRWALAGAAVVLVAGGVAVALSRPGSKPVAVTATPPSPRQAPPPPPPRPSAEAETLAAHALERGAKGDVEGALADARRATEL